jgi:hypothetical protein
MLGPVTNAYLNPYFVMFLKQDFGGQFQQTILNCNAGVYVFDRSETHKKIAVIASYFLARNDDVRCLIADEIANTSNLLETYNNLFGELGPYDHFFGMFRFNYIQGKFCLIAKWDEFTNLSIPLFTSPQ